MARPANLIDPAGGPVRDFIDGGYQDTEWYEDLSVVERLAADAFFDRLAGVDPSGWILEYDIQKTPIAPWGGSVGAQIDLTRAWHFMVEAGIFGPRKSLNVSLNYRFAF